VKSPPICTWSPTFATAKTPLMLSVAGSHAWSDPSEAAKAASRRRSASTVGQSKPVAGCPVLPTHTWANWPPTYTAPFSVAIECAAPSTCRTHLNEPRTP
jgi:hypothetical protein